MEKLDLRKLLDNNDIDISSVSIDNLEKFSDILLEWNKIHNLTGAKDKKSVYENIIDALYPVSFIDFPKSILDVGTGAGFPGLVLAIVKEESHFTLCEPLKKRAAFLRFVVTMLGVSNVTIIAKRVEELGDICFDLITSRAVTNTKLLLNITKNQRGADTKYLLYKGSLVFEEIEDISDCEPKYDIFTKNKRNYLYIKSINVV
ncbi:MAG: 16S rRNA (guanine(527)-N(7))-methyltransferase RsmG [Epsilonproteobacteria bacterium]|nr:16S rRNA (guanine(527)-N(7))-methyltransferase RsmG [Campylobacterota bacterium]